MLMPRVNNPALKQTLDGFDGTMAIGPDAVMDL